MDFQDLPPDLVVPAAALGFVLLWLLACAGIARLGGWSRLAARYSQSMRIPGKRLRGQSGALRYGMGYNNALTFTLSRRGLGLSVMFLFRAGHPPLLIPWRDIVVVSERTQFGSLVRLSLARVPDVRITLTEGTAERLRAAAGELWPGE
jgi:hypothetical protein